MAPPPPEEPSLLRSLPLLGRERETSELRAALDRARRGQGESWALLGPGGIGKTRLLRWLEEQGAQLGFELRTGSCLRESVAPFFPFEQLFRRAAPLSASGRPDDARQSGPLETVLLVEEARPKRFWSIVEAQASRSPLLVVSRDRPASLRSNRPALSAAVHLLCLTRMEGVDHVAPSALDALGERLEQHLRSAPGAVVAVEGLEYLVSQGSFPPVLRLVQFLRDVAQDCGGHVVLTVNRSALEPRELSLLESDAEVLREAAPTADVIPGVPSAEPPSAVLLRYLSTLEAASRRQPQLLVLDDLQWADSPSVAAFQFLARNLRSLPVLLVGGLREEASPGAPAPVAETLDGLERDGALHRATLRGLGEEDARRLGAAVAGAENLELRDPAALAGLVRRTEGNPYFLREIFYQFLEEGSLRREGVKASLELPALSSMGSTTALPETIRRLVVRRLQALSPEERSLLDCAALAGSEFDLEPLAEILGASLPEARRRVEGLHRRHRLVEPEGNRWCCAHPLVWEVTLSEMEVATREHLARLLASWWVEHRPHEVETIARLFHDARDPENGRVWVKRAFEDALRRLSGETGAVYLRWMDELHRARPTVDWEEVREEISLAISIDPLGVPALARDRLKDLLSEGPPAPLCAEILAGLAWTTRDLDLKESEEHASRFAELAAREGARVGPVPRVFVELARSANFAARLDHAGALLVLHRCEELLRGLPLDDVVVRLQAGVHGQLAFALTNLGRGQEAHQVADAGLTLLAGRASPLSLAPLINARGVTLRQLGDHQRACRDFRECARLSREGGRILGVCIADLNAVGCLEALGDLESADRLVREALDLGRKFAYPRAEMGAHANLAQLAGLRGDWASARAEARLSLEESARSGRRLWEAEMHAVLAMAQGELGEDVPGARHALEGLIAKGELFDPDALVEVERVASRLARRMGDRAGARSHLQAARAALALRPTPFLDARILEEEAAEAREAGDHEGAQALLRQAEVRQQEARRGWPQEPPILPSASSLAPL